jgi:hypothetical protein
MHPKRNWAYGFTYHALKSPLKSNNIVYPVSSCVCNCHGVTTSVRVAKFHPYSHLNKIYSSNIITQLIFQVNYNVHRRWNMAVCFRKVHEWLLQLKIKYGSDWIMSFQCRKHFLTFSKCYALACVLEIVSAMLPSVPYQNSLHICQFFHKN